MPRKSIGETAMTDAERQARYRAARAAGVPIVRTRHQADHRGRARRWTDHVTGLVKEQAEFMAWLVAALIVSRAVSLIVILSLYP